MIRNDQTNELLRIKDTVVSQFSKEHWLEVGLITNQLEIVQMHGRLLRSLSFGDDDYSGNALSVLMQIIDAAPENFDRIRLYLDEKFPRSDETFVSARSMKRRITFAPTVFEVPDAPLDEKLVAVMMPFSQEFRSIYESIRAACEDAGLTCRRADDIWEHSVLIQDIFRLIFTARIVVCDFTGRNPNVMYETGIAHTLGKIVIPITQNGGDVPFDLLSHRYLTYLSNSEGRDKLRKDLGQRFSTLTR